MPDDLRQLHIVFMGTPDFAVASLNALQKSGYNIVAVVTAPDKPAGRGLKLNESAVKKYASDHGLKILQPEKLKSPEFMEELRSLGADLQIVVAFRMLPKAVWNMPPGGTINLHGSLLPQYRGAAPINWAVINGEKETGVSTFKLKHEVDTGDILLQKPIPIGENETAGELHDRMKEIGAQLLVKTLEGIVNDRLKETPQENIQYSYEDRASQHITTDSRITAHDSRLLKHAPKIFTETCRIDWNKSAEEIHNLIRGLSPFPGAFTVLDGKMLKIYRSEKEITLSLQTGTVRPGEPSPPVRKDSFEAARFETDKKTFLKFACSNGYIRILELQLEGKKKMLTGEFLRGYRSF